MQVLSLWYYNRDTQNTLSLSLTRPSLLEYFLELDGSSFSLVYISVGRISGITYLHKSTSFGTNTTLADVFSSNHPRITGQIVEKMVGELMTKQIPIRSG